LAEFAHNPHTKSEILELARTALSLREDYARARKKYPGERGVDFPLHSAYRIGLDEKPTPPQACMIKWREKYWDYLQRLRDHYAFRGELTRLDCFPRAGPPTGKEVLIGVLDRHVDLLARELDESDPGAALELRLDTGQLAKILRDARGRRLTQAEAAVELDVSEDTYKAWELERNKPVGKNRRKVETFVRRALLKSE
jgi:hypothetical protein